MLIVKANVRMLGKFSENIHLFKFSNLLMQERIVTGSDFVYKTSPGYKTTEELWDGEWRNVFRQNKHILMIIVIIYRENVICTSCDLPTSLRHWIK